MEQNLQLQAKPVPKSVQIKQYIAIGLFILICCYSVITPIFGNIIPYDIMESIAPNIEIWKTYNIFNHFLYFLVYVIIWGILLTITSNKATKIAVILYIVSAVLELIFISLGLLHNGLWNVGLIATGIAYFYVFSTIIRANNLSNSDKAWLSIYLISMVMSIASLGRDILILNLADDTMGDLFEYIPGRMASIWGVIFSIIVCVASIRLVKCGAFSGNYDSTPTPKEVYSPLNKHFAALLITLVVVYGMWSILYSNIQTIENILN
ncbi:MAG: hypothetical protein IIY05_04785 [Alistipes sp.]|nr:hypothetical protein [Alistipes sp.]